MIGFKTVVAMQLGCSYCTSRLLSHAHHTELSQLADWANRLAATLETRAFKAGWTRQPYTDTHTEWRCKKCTALLAQGARS
jgi:DNA-directed RNA polymerase subunit RPC12/RpoP